MDRSSNETSPPAIAVSLGHGAAQSVWNDVQSLPWPELQALLTNHQPGHKDGPCITPATFSGRTRGNSHAVRIGVIMLDSDGGAPLAEIQSAIVRHGWAAVIASTHSHLGTQTKAKRGAYELWCRQHDLDPTGPAAPNRFLVEDRHMRREIASGAVIASQDDVHTTFLHQPCPRYRVAMPLSRPWVAEAYRTSREAIDAWRAAYAAAAAALDLEYDRACTDPARLFYLPRHPPAGPAPEAAVLDGAWVNIFSLPVVEEKPKAPARRQSEKRDANGRQRQSTKEDNGGTDHQPFGLKPGISFTDPSTGESIDLRRWAAREGKHFMLAAALRARSPHVLRPRLADERRQHILCPNADAHTSPDADLATFVCDAGKGENAKGFVIHCRHSHCVDRDRLGFLQQMLEQRWLQVADLNDRSFLTGDAIRELEIGSDAEIAERVVAELTDEFGLLINDEGQFWRYNGQHWLAIDDEVLWRSVFRFDGATFRTASGEPANVKLNKSRTESVLACMQAMVRHRRFFASAPRGINCSNGFIRFDACGVASLSPHRREDRQRHVLGSRWRPADSFEIANTSLLHSLLNGCFKDDADREAKIDLLAEIAGVAATGMGTRLIEPKAVVCVGKHAENGKSQVLAALRSLLPKDAVSAISPAKFADRTFACHLAGKLLNAPDELAGADAIASEAFKQIITGEPMTARDVYKSAVEFEPMAQHVFATNVLPPFKGGMDRGVRRRLMVVTFNRVIPRTERIDRIGARIGKEEADLLLAWAVLGASRVIRKGSFTVPSSSADALRDWMFSSDPVLAWLASDEVEIDKHDLNLETKVSDAHGKFARWAIAEGFRQETLPAINNFSQRVEAANSAITKKRTSAGAYLLGLACIGPVPDAARHWRQ